MAYNYCVTFRIADETVNGRAYDERRQQLIDNVTAENAGYWAETTSFLLAESSLGTYEFAKKAHTGLSAKHDLVVVFDPEDMSAAYFGPLRHVDVLKSFFPQLQKSQ